MRVRGRMKEYRRDERTDGQIGTRPPYVDKGCTERITVWRRVKNAVIGESCFARRLPWYFGGERSISTTEFRCVPGGCLISALQVRKRISPRPCVYQERSYLRCRPSALSLRRCCSLLILGNCRYRISPHIRPPLCAEFCVR